MKSLQQQELGQEEGDVTTQKNRNTDNMRQGEAMRPQAGARWGAKAGCMGMSRASLKSQLA